MRPSQALALHKDTILEVLKKYPVKNPRVFGSTLKGTDTDESDLDILVGTGETLTLFDLAKIEIELKHLTGVRVDIRTDEEFTSRRLTTLPMKQLAQYV
jgi:uncharacterized protein